MVINYDLYNIKKEQCAENQICRSFMKSLGNFIAVMVSITITLFLLNQAYAIEKAPLQLATDFALPDLSGRMVSLKDFKGKIVIVDFWATWCVPCRNTMRELSAIDKKYKNKDVVVLGISIDDPASFDNDYIKRFLKNHEVVYQILRADKNVIKDYLGVLNVKVPVMFIIDRKGRIAWKIVGFEPGVAEKHTKELLSNY